MKVQNTGAEQQDMAEKSIEADINKLILLGRVERTVTPMAGVSVSMHSLSDEERAAALAESGVKIMLGDMGDPKVLMEKLESAQIPILVQSISNINGQDYSGKEKKEALRMLLGQMQSAVIMFLFLEYVSIMTDQYSLLSAGVKKN